MWEMDYDTASKYWIEKDKESKHLVPEKVKEVIDEFIKANNTCALATSSASMTRCTPIEYIYMDGCFYMFTEGGQKFVNLKENVNVGIAIYSKFTSFGDIHSLQAMGTAELIEPFSEEYIKACEFRKLPVTALKKLPKPMYLLKVVPKCFDIIDSDLKKEGYGNRQHLDL